MCGKFCGRSRRKCQCDASIGDRLNLCEKLQYSLCNNRKYSSSKAAALLRSCTAPMSSKPACPMKIASIWTRLSRWYARLCNDIRLPHSSKASPFIPNPKLRASVIKYTDSQSPLHTSSLRSIVCVRCSNRSICKAFSHECIMISGRVEMIL